FKKAMKIATSTDVLKKPSGGDVNQCFIFFHLPFIILAMACVMLVPFLLESVPLVRWSLAQKGVYYFYIFVVSYGWLLIIGFIILCSIIAYTMPRWVGKKRFYADQFPPYSFYKQLQGATFITCIDALLSSNIPLKSACLHCHQAENRNEFSLLFDERLYRVTVTRDAYKQLAFVIRQTPDRIRAINEVGLTSELIT
ncbi:PilR type IV pilus biosynthesis protein, partial [Candidatus Regiella insecticola 5.15]